MYFLILNDLDPELQDLFPEGVPTFSATPDEFVEIYDESGLELVDIQPAFRVNLGGLSADRELKLLAAYTSELNDPHFIRGCFKLLDKGWVTIPEDRVASVVWRYGDYVFSAVRDGSSAIADPVEC
jgi:hypothetical protein